MKSYKGVLLLLAGLVGVAISGWSVKEEILYRKNLNSAGWDLLE